MGGSQTQADELEWYRRQITRIRSKASEVRGQPDEAHWREMNRDLFRGLCSRRGLPYAPEVFEALWLGDNGHGHTQARRALGLGDPRAPECDQN